MQKVELDPNLMSDQQRVSYKRLLLLSFPLMIQGLVTTIMTMVDRVFMSNYDVAQFTAITPAFSVGFSISAFFNGIVWFTSTLTAQYFGAGQTTKLKLPMWSSIFFGIISSILLLMLMPFANKIFVLFGHDKNLINYESIYLKFILCTTIAGLFSAAIGGYFAGIGRTSVSMWAAIAGNLANIVLDWWFIYGGFGLPAMGITGAGLATLLGGVVTLLVSMGVLLADGWIGWGKELKILKPEWDADIFKRLLFFGMPAAAQLTIDSTGFAILLLFMGKLGWAPTAAASIVLSLQLFSYLPIVNIAAGCGIIVGQERGAGRLNNISLAVKKTMILAITLSSIICAAMLIWPDVMIIPFTNTQQAAQMDEIRRFFGPMMIVSAAWLVIDAVLNVYLHSLKALGDTTFIMISYLILTPLVSVLPAWIIVETVKSPTMLWSVVALFVFVLMIVMGLRYYSGAWKNLHVISAEDEATPIS